MLIDISKQPAFKLTFQNNWFMFQLSLIAVFDAPIAIR